MKIHIFYLHYEITGTDGKYRPHWFDYEKLIECVKSDKKNTGCINMVLIKNEKPVVQKIEDYSIIDKALKEVYESI